ncbi:MAG: TGS domain-containing protein [Desulfobacteraceae bacterium]|nr:MAG: TGS domain-containing protein [Desulfobacteraceae bacterium]
MPANLPPQYFEAEKRYREAGNPAEKVEALEEMLTIMPKHKGTDKLRASLRRKISKFKDQSRQKKGTSRAETAYSIDKEGAAQVVVIGPPNSGKSSLIGELTNAKPEVADFPHSTWKPTPGMVPYENVQFQLIDTPPITPEYIDPWMADLIRRCEIIAILIDLKKDPLEQFEETFFVLQGLRVFPEDFPIPKDLRKSPFIKKMIVLVNKVDDVSDQEDYEIFLDLWESQLPSLAISTRRGYHLTQLLEIIYDLAGIIRVFTKAPGKKPDHNNPFVIPKNSTLEELAGRIHKDFVSNLKFARIWGKSVFDGQMVQRDHILQEGDVVEIHT